VGGCHLDSKTDKIIYMHSSLGSAKWALVIEDICAELSRLYKGVPKVQRDTTAAVAASRALGWFSAAIQPVFPIP
jgi:hypothetical protein